MKSLWTLNFVNVCVAFFQFHLLIYLEHLSLVFAWLQTEISQLVSGMTFDPVVSADGRVFSFILSA